MWSVQPAALPKALRSAWFQLQFAFLLHFFFVCPRHDVSFGGDSGAGLEVGMQCITGFFRQPRAALHAEGVWYWVHGSTNLPHLSAETFQKHLLARAPTVSPLPSPPPPWTDWPPHGFRAGGDPPRHGARGKGRGGGFQMGGSRRGPHSLFALQSPADSVSQSTV